MKLRYWLSLFSLTLFLGLMLPSCSQDSILGEAGQPQPTSFGAINRLTVVADTNLITTDIRDSLAFFFEAPFLILPQPEPIFDLDITRPYYLQAEPVSRQLRSYLVLANLDDEFSETNKMVKRDLNERQLEKVEQEGFISVLAEDKWAKNQRLYYLVGRDLENLHAGMRRVYPTIVKSLKEREYERWETTAYVQGPSGSMRREVASRLGATMEVPQSYVLSPLADTSVMWLRRFVRAGSINILLGKVPYTDEAQLTEAGYKQIINDMGGEYISSDKEDSYLMVNDSDLPVFFEQVQLGDNYSLEARGIWEMSGEHMAGPFISYLIPNEERGELLLVMGFAHAPNRKKRDMMEELSVVLRTARF
ncbi:MAG: DUF4837 family protein [Bacteroidota bacterium]